MALDDWRPSRRGLLRGLVATGAGAAAGWDGYGVAYERHQVHLVRADVTIVGLPRALDGVRIGLITDTHSNATVPMPTSWLPWTCCRPSVQTWWHSVATT